MTRRGSVLGRRTRSLRDALRHPSYVPSLWEVRRRGLSMMSVDALSDLVASVRLIERSGVEGALIEAGVARGGSAILLGRAKERPRALRLYDVFGMIPPPGAEDGEDVHRRYEEIAAGAAVGASGETYYGYRNDLKGEVVSSLQSFGLDLGRDHISLVEGRFEDTMSGLEGPVALAHVDGDWYSSVATVLGAVAPVLASGGRIIVDDYDAWSGCRKAVDEFLDGGEFVAERRARVHLVRR